jgi:PhnB protein
MQVIPYLAFNGNCEEAFKLYAEALNGRIVALHRFADMPAEFNVSEDQKDKVSHVRLDADGAVLMGSDNPPDRYKPAAGICVSIGVDDPAEAERIYAALSDGGSVQMPIQQTFFAKRFAMFTDRFGTPWMINCD